MTSPLSRRDLVRAVVLVALTIAVWLTARGRWREDAWLSAPEYDIDALETVARIKMTAEHGLSFFADKHIPELGAPFGADWSSYPMPDLLVFWVLGNVAKVFGLLAACNLAILLAAVVNVLAFFFCSRVLGHRPLFAGCAAMLFAFSHYNITRGLSHYSLTLSFTAPAVLLVAWLVGSSRKLLHARRWQVFCLLTAAATAMGSPYYGMMFVMLVVMAMLYQFATGRRRDNLVAGFAGLVVWGLVTAACNYTSIVGMFETSHRVLMHRNYSSTEINGLRPIEWAVPPPYHRLPGASEFTQEYGRVTIFEGEHYTSYLGVIGLCGMGLIIFLFLRALLRGRASLRPAWAPTAAFIVAFGMVGGLGSIIALTVTVVFRAGNRYTVFILAIVLLAMTALASVKWRRLPAVAAGAASVLLVLIGLWDQMRRFPSKDELARRARHPGVDKQLGDRLEELLPPGSMVFMLPAVPFLEQAPIVGMTDYELFRPYLFTKNIRFWYGILANQDAIVWQRRVSRLSLDKMRVELEAAGFAALYICRSAYVDGAQAMRKGCESAGISPIFDAGPHLVYRLNPAKEPKLPELSGPNRYEPWDGQAADPTRLTLLEGHGWFVAERDSKSSWRWGGKEAVNVLWNPTGSRRSVRVRCTIIGRDVQHLTISLAADGRELWHGEVRHTAVPAEFPLELEPGETELKWTYHGTPMRASPSDRRLLGFRVNDLVIEER